MLASLHSSEKSDANRPGTIQWIQRSIPEWNEISEVARNQSNVGSRYSSWSSNSPRACRISLFGVNRSEGVQPLRMGTANFTDNLTRKLYHSSMSSLLFRVSFFLRIRNVVTKLQKSVNDTCGYVQVRMHHAVTKSIKVPAWMQHSVIPWRVYIIMQIQNVVHSEELSNNLSATAVYITQIFNHYSSFTCV